MAHFLAFIQMSLLHLQTSQFAAMGAIGPSLLYLFSLATLLAVVTGTEPKKVEPSQYASFNRSLFPDDFLFGIGSSAYQVHTITQYIYFVTWTTTQIALATMYSITHFLVNTYSNIRASLFAVFCYYYLNLDSVHGDFLFI